MGVKVAPTVVPHSQTLASAIASSSSSSSSSTSWRRRRIDRSLSCRFVPRPDPSAFLCSRIAGTRSTPLRRAFSASLDAFPDDDDDEEEEFVKKLQELALEFTVSDEESVAAVTDSRESRGTAPAKSPPWLHIRPEPAMDFETVSVERAANGVGLPLSLRIIKQKKRWEISGGDGGGLIETVGETAYCSLKKAFSSMVFIIRELQSYTLQMREILSYQDLQGILVRVQREMHASFVWLFQRIFSTTPTLMVYLMLLLANFTVYSMGHDIAIAAASAGPPPQVTVESVPSLVDSTVENTRFDAPSIKSSSSGRTASVGGSGGGGWKASPVAGATDDGGNLHCTVAPTSDRKVEEEEKLWDSVVEAAETMRHAALDHETLRRFVSPVTVEVEPDDPTAYLKTEIEYLRALDQEPHNAMVLANFAQFLYLVLNDHNRAEEYFKRAAEIEPADAEALSRYASFLWMARNDIAAAEETYLEAIAADPSNTAYAAGYAHFLWSTGGEDTCFPLDGMDDDYDDA
ncbi:hypothetical protein QJS04_geneDACA011447 [Acorus gramineus]|uniref:Uncharacterized protein n=1 Tax=Acorus gramineus TaxID=55184 RepID=A0AAV9ALJ7_ACOGR|nr:hypothetical protein QJS04_geneDACA011447 [Acorus gramineus]